MKKLTGLLLFAFLSSTIQGQEKKEAAQSILANACQQAKAGHKKVMVIFHASWCGWCHKMDSSMLDKKCKPFFEANYVIVHLTVEETPNKKKLEDPGAYEIKKKYLGENAGLPFWIILDENGKLLADCFIRKQGISADKAGDNIGCPATENEVVAFTTVLKRTSKLTEVELAIIAKRFRENKSK